VTRRKNAANAMSNPRSTASRGRVGLAFVSSEKCRMKESLEYGVEVTERS